ncbi:hypothetical protein GJW-30_1_01558 [Variibacter gotjawalensis]|uniref:Phosphodiester glycosidase domain-containing protein n=1 Tax=Variibacter gotjawalensis TaxID=1333996 RepID=A0A0S3PST8_9BRAD|nr:hypothetical protein [Variibacter gotjawalensis]NIK49343.1 hypothetical protein [Variibacter gotjawalensis]RZS51194.1 hypothetical protein EV661_3671 [Variibacter gotjawalensis]BAT59029.1 hypothetical protein GJW-30_1_01558 [Variibacter gotjawalensis]
MLRLTLAAVMTLLAFPLAAQELPTAADVVHPPGLPAIGKWMIDRDGTIAHWLGQLDGRLKLREPINVIFVDGAAKTPDDARRRLIAASTAAGYPVRFGHSAGYRALIGSDRYPQLPSGRDDAFSNGIFELSNNHGRIFGPHPFDGGFVSIAAFSRESIDLIRWPMHAYASFLRAREDYADRLDRLTAFKRSGYAELGNALRGDPGVTTGDHDGRAVILKAER